MDISDMSNTDEDMKIPLKGLIESFEDNMYLVKFGSCSAQWEC